MDDEQRRKAKKQVIDLMQAGHSWQEATTLAEEHGVDFAALELREGERLHLLRVGITPQQALSEIGEAIVLLC